MLWFKQSLLPYLWKMVIYIFRLYQVHQNSWCWRRDSEKHICIVLKNYIQYITQQGPREGHLKLSFYYRRINHYGFHMGHGILVGLSNEINIKYVNIMLSSLGYQKYGSYPTLLYEGTTLAGLDWVINEGDYSPIQKIIALVTLVLSHQSSEQKMSREAGFMIWNFGW